MTRSVKIALDKGVKFVVVERRKNRLSINALYNGKVIAIFDASQTRRGYAMSMVECFADKPYLPNIVVLPTEAVDE